MYFEDFTEGQEWKTKGRTVTESDIVIFSTLTGAYNPLFLDEEYTKRTRFGTRISPGLLTASLAVGLTYQLQSDPFGEGFIALERLEANAKRPVKIGDTISAIVKVVKKEDRGKNGRINISVNCVNQRNETVMEILLSVIVNKKHQT